MKKFNFYNFTSHKDSVKNSFLFYFYNFKHIDNIYKNYLEEKYNIMFKLKTFNHSIINPNVSQFEFINFNEYLNTINFYNSNSNKNDFVYKFYNFSNITYNFKFYNHDPNLLDFKFIYINHDKNKNFEFKFINLKPYKNNK